MMKNKGSKTKKDLVSLIVPAYNEETIIQENLASLSRYMNSLENKYDWEMIIINDGSSDSTGDLADEFAKDMANVRVLHHMFNFRVGQALRYAINSCKGNYVVVLDIDLSYSPEHIEKMLSKIETTKAKIVIASPYAKEGKVSNVPWIRKILSIWANRFLCLVANKDWYSDRLTNITGMVRTYDGIFLRSLCLKAMDVDINPEIIYKAKILRASIVEIPAHLNWKPANAPLRTIKKRSSRLRIIRGIIQSFLSGFILRPFMFFAVPGLIFMILSFYPIAWIIIHTRKFYEQVANLGLTFDHRLSRAIANAFQLSPHAFIVGGFTLLLALQLISLGFLAYQKKRYFEELYFFMSTSKKNSQL